MPVGGFVLAVLVLPALAAVAIGLVMHLMGTPPQTSQIQLIRYVYPAVLSLILLWYTHQQIVFLIKSWMAAVRDEEYLIGRRLHNLGDVAPPAAIVGEREEFAVE